MLGRFVILLLCGAVPLPGGAVQAQGEHVQMRAHVVPMREMALRKAQEWQVGKPDTRACLDLGAMAAAVMVDGGTVDIVMKGGRRWRVLLDRQCQQLSFYGGIYYQPSRAGQICAGRDKILSRAGGSCRVRAIAPMTPVKTEKKRP